MQIIYVMGFLFSPDKSKVVLIEKKRPDFLAGNLNGVGGIVEPKETAQEAMQREFVEEAGLYLEWNESKIRWGINADEISIWVFGAFSENYDKVSSMTDEIVKIYDMSDLYKLNLAPLVLTSIALLLDNTKNAGVTTYI